MTKSQEHQSSKTEMTTTIQGGCHCGAVRFVAKIDAEPLILNCNCSICAMSGFQHLLVKHQNFELLSGQEQLSNYQFNTHTAQHLFCSVCGIKSFYQPRSHADSWSINTRCIEGFDNKNWQIKSFEGSNWEQAKEELDHA